MALTDFKLFELLQSIFNMLVEWGAQLWNLFTYDLHDALEIIPAGTTIITALPIVGAVVIIVAIIIKLIV